jgi:hypothetical protein
MERQTTERPVLSLATCRLLSCCCPSREPLDIITEEHAFDRWSTSLPVSITHRLLQSTSRLLLIGGTISVLLRTRLLPPLDPHPEVIHPPDPIIPELWKVKRISQGPVTPSQQLYHQPCQPVSQPISPQSDTLAATRVTHLTKRLIQLHHGNPPSIQTNCPLPNARSTLLFICTSLASSRSSSHLSGRNHSASSPQNALSRQPCQMTFPVATNMPPWR